MNLDSTPLIDTRASIIFKALMCHTRGHTVLESHPGLGPPLLPRALCTPPTTGSGVFAASQAAGDRWVSWLHNPRVPAFGATLSTLSSRAGPQECTPSGRLVCRRKIRVTLAPTLWTRAGQREHGAELYAGQARPPCSDVSQHDGPLQLPCLRAGVGPHCPQQWTTAFFLIFPFSYSVFLGG